MSIGEREEKKSGMCKETAETPLREKSAAANKVARNSIRPASGEQKGGTEDGRGKEEEALIQGARAG